MTHSAVRRHGFAIAGALLLVYALLGNYVALPGYLRFLERGGTSAAGHAFDLAVLIGAAKTILWMYSFQLGVLCLAVVKALREELPIRHLLIGGAGWLVIWSWPTLPAPGPGFYVTLGSLLLVLIGASLLRSEAASDGAGARLRLLAAFVFFAFATWEVCGLGSTGRMLHPDEAAQPIAHNLLVTQSSKLMIEFVIAWALLLSTRLPVRTRSARAAP